MSKRVMAVSIVCQLAVALLITSSPMRADPGSCGTENLWHLWCSECAETGPNYFQAFVWECQPSGWVAINSYSGPDEEECQEMEQTCHI